jgi:hypothetical protein
MAQKREKQWFTLHYIENKILNNMNHIKKPDVNSDALGKVSSSCSTSYTRRVTVNRHGRHEHHLAKGNLFLSCNRRRITQLALNINHSPLTQPDKMMVT